MKEKYAELVLLLVGIFWGFGYIAVDLLVDKMGAFTLIGMRFLIASVFLGLIYYKRLRLKEKELFKVTIVGAALFIAFAFQTIAMTQTSTTNVSFITGTNVIFVPVIAFVLSKAKLEVKNLVAAVLAVIGLSFLTGGLSEFQSGDILALLCAFFFALHIALIGKYASDVDIVKLAIWQMFICAMISFVVAFVSGEAVIESVRTVNVKLMLFTGIVPSALCFLGQNIGLKYTSEAKGSLILNTESLWGAIFAIILLGEDFSISLVFAAILMVSAILIDEINIKELK